MKYLKEQTPKNERIAQNFFFLIKDIKEEINIKDIIYIQADVNYSTFYTNTRHFTTSFNLGFFEKSLETKPDFIRINKSYILNINYLRGLDWDKNIKEAHLKDGTRLPISRRRAKVLKDLLWDKVNAK